MRALSLPVALCLLTVLAGCRKQVALPPEPAPGDRLLTVDGIDVTFGELQPYSDFLGRYWADSGRRARIGKIVDDLILPLRLAQRALARERQQLLERARALSAVAGNAIELEQHGKALGVRKNVTPGRVDIPTAMFLFDEARIGSVSPPIEVPQGFLVCAAFQVDHAAVAVDDIADAFIVGFTTARDQVSWIEWLGEQQRAITDKVTYVHSDYRDVLPHWLKAPTTPTPQ